jgi:Protein of unknown function (DUF3000)
MTGSRQAPRRQPLRPAGQLVPDGSEAAEFQRAVAGLDAGLAAQGEHRPGLVFEREPPPRRLAPHACAVAATVTDYAARTDAEIAWGKFVLLFDPAGQPGWDGQYRVIGYVRAELEPEMAIDPLINAVGWSWLTEALDAAGAGYRKISGTVTSVITQGFGAKEHEPNSTSFELRASWSPVPDGTDPGLDLHAAAWCDVIWSAAGLPPTAPGVSALRQRRRTGL